MAASTATTTRLAQGQFQGMNADMVWGMIAALLIGNFLLPLLNILLVGIFVRLLSVSPKYLLPIILGLLLGPEMEKNLRHTLDIANGVWTALWGSGLAIGLWVVAFVGLMLPYIVGPILLRWMRAAAEVGNQIE